MQDRKALQAGTSHFLGQNFSRASRIQFLDREGKVEFAWTTSWGVSTRLVGALVMTHADDDGLVLPPKLAPKHVVLMPIHRNEEERRQVLEYCRTLAREIEALDYGEDTAGAARVLVEMDDRDLRGGEKAWQHVKRGVPLRVEIGPRDIAKGSVSVARRDRPVKEKRDVLRSEFVATLTKLLDEMQRGLLDRADAFRKEHTRHIDSRADFDAFFGRDDSDDGSGETHRGEGSPQREIHGGFALAHWSDEPASHEILQKLKVTPRCIPLDAPEEEGRCIFTGKPSRRRVVFARAY